VILVKVAYIDRSFVLFWRHGVVLPASIGVTDTPTWSHCSTGIWPLYATGSDRA